MIYDKDRWETGSVFQKKTKQESIQILELVFTQGNDNGNPQFYVQQIEHSFTRK